MTRTWSDKVHNDLLLAFYGVVQITREQQVEIVDYLKGKDHDIHNWDTIRCEIPAFSPHSYFIVLALLSCCLAKLLDCSTLFFLGSSHLTPSSFVHVSCQAAGPLDSPSFLKALASLVQSSRLLSPKLSLP